MVRALEDRCLLSAGYLQINLVSDVPGLAHFTDAALIDAWGLAAGPTTPFWVSDNGTHVTSLYDGVGQPVGGTAWIPAPGGSFWGTPTGVVFNGGSGFVVCADGRSGPAMFLFATEDGTIVGWSPAVNLSQGILAVNRSGAGAIYKGLALAQDAAGQPLLYATNFSAGTVDVFDSQFRPVAVAGGFVDPHLPPGFAPFGIQDIGGLLYVTYAKQDATGYNDVAGPGNGFVDVYSGDGVLLRRLAWGGPLNSPWGLAQAPAGFGELSGAILVGNFGDGRINAYDPTSGKFLGALEDGRGQPVVIPNLWALQFGNSTISGDANTLYFTAGIGGEQHGLFGELVSLQDPPPAAGQPAGGADPSPGTGDDYPLPPATGPGPRGGITQPTLPRLFPVREAAGSAVTPSARITPDAVLRVDSAGHSFVSSGQAASAPGAAPPAPADGLPIARAGRPGAVDILLSLNGPSDGAEQVSVASFPSRGPSATGADPASGTEGGQVVVSAVGRNNGWSAETSPAPVEVQFAGLLPDEQTPALPPAGTAADAGAEPPPEPAPGADAGEQRRGDRTPGGRVSYPVTALLVLGSVCLTWGIGQTARRATWGSSANSPAVR
jgi:uncharacterized protein (TIGR03118 family)